MLLKCECNYKDTINYGIMWIVSYIRIFVERFIVVYAFYPKKKNRAHARLWNIKKVKCQGIRLPVSHHFPLFWILVEEIHHRTQCKTKVVQLQVHNKIWMQSDFVYQYSITQNQSRYWQLISVNLRVGRIQMLLIL